MRIGSTPDGRLGSYLLTLWEDKSGEIYLFEQRDPWP